MNRRFASFSLAVLAGMMMVACAAAPTTEVSATEEEATEAQAFLAESTPVDDAGEAG